MIEARFHLAYPGGFELKVDLSLPGDGVTAVVGPSGSGKSTFLRCLAGLSRPEGFLSVNGRIWQDERLFVPTHKRSVGFVFQDARLFPHLSVKENLFYGAKRRREARDVFENFGELLESFGLGKLLERRPETLSGGERQRVALARALAARPELLLLDEPLAAVDPDRKEEIFPYLEKLRGLKLPVLYVSHSREEVERLADRVVNFPRP